MRPSRAARTRAARRPTTSSVPPAPSTSRVHSSRPRYGTCTPGSASSPRPTPAEQRAPAVRPQVLVGEPAGQQRERERAATRDDARPRARAAAAASRAAPSSAEPDEHGDARPPPTPGRLGRLEQLHPVQRRRRRRRASSTQPRTRPAAAARAPPARGRRAAPAAGAARRRSVLTRRPRPRPCTAALPVRPATKPWQPATSSTARRPAIPPGTTSRQPPGVRPEAARRAVDHARGDEDDEPAAVLRGRQRRAGGVLHQRQPDVRLRPGEQVGLDRRPRAGRRAAAARSRAGARSGR